MGQAQGIALGIAYKIEELKYSQQITKALGINSQNADHAFEKYKRWKQENPNPIEQLAQQLNPILFSLAVKTSFDFESIEDLKFIQIQTKGGTEINAIKLTLKSYM